MPRLLICESDEILADCYREFLALRGFEVATALGGTQCLALLRRGLPDLLILDLDIFWGGADGVLDWLMVDHRPPPIPVVLTALPGSSAALSRLARLPGVRTLIKPFRLHDLHESVNAALHWEPDADPMPALPGIHSERREL